MLNYCGYFLCKFGENLGYFLMEHLVTLDTVHLQFGVGHLWTRLAI